MRIGILGGTFNPIHFGHLRAAEEAREMLGLDKVVFIPSGIPPLKTQDIAGTSHRLAMARLAVKDNHFFTVLDIECRSTGKSYTVKTLDTLKKRYRGSELFFILGIDTFLDIPLWWKPEKLITLVNFAVFSRPGNRFVDLLSSPYLDREKASLSRLDRGKAWSFKTAWDGRDELVLLRITALPVSATDIRERIKAGKSIKYLLPEDVESYIISKKLYKK
jgi:nicotinate-nucleotide adenylyltransferase